MAKNHSLPILVTFDGEARSGKGSVVQATKDYIRETKNLKVMLIDAGQVFRVLVVGATRAGVDLDNAEEIDAFLGDDSEAEKCTQLVKAVYHMEKVERDALLYSNEVSHNSAKISKRPLSMTFKDQLLRKWFRDARAEGYDIILLDGRALEEVGQILESEGLCEFRLGLYFICDPVTGARRTLGFADRSYEQLSDEEKTAVDTLVDQINVRNQSDRDHIVQPLVRPQNVEVSRLPDIKKWQASGRPMYLIDTSNDMTKESMCSPVAELVASYI